MTDKLQLLREDGKEIITPEYVIVYSPLQNAFIVDIHDCKKYLEFRVKNDEETYYWDISGMYPASVRFNGSYEEAWAIIQDLIDGATIDKIPSFKNNGVEYVIVEGEEGEMPVPKSEITIND